VNFNEDFNDVVTIVEINWKFFDLCFI
jgi:hypothetical protein